VAGRTLSVGVVSAQRWQIHQVPSSLYCWPPAVHAPQLEQQNGQRTLRLRRVGSDGL
jgi:hypothetical protein